MTIAIDKVSTINMIKNKITLYKKIKSKFVKSVEDIIQVSFWRFLAENIMETTIPTLTSHSFANTRSQNRLTISFEDEMKLKCTLIYMYIFVCLKNQRFYPDFNLRTKLIWELHSKKKKDELKQEICRWVYWLDDNEIEEFVNGNSTRNNSSFEYFEKYFIRNEEEKIASIKDCY